MPTTTTTTTTTAALARVLDDTRDHEARIVEASKIADLCHEAGQHAEATLWSLLSFLVQAEGVDTTIEDEADEQDAFEESFACVSTVEEEAEKAAEANPEHAAALQTIVNSVRSAYEGEEDELPAVRWVENHAPMALALVASLLRGRP